jgi:energy-coupling factor transporter ATP-binding protein EcfA2
LTIDRVIIKNYRVLRSADVSLNSDLNIIVGDNESGKSTLLEAINLALKCQLNRRPAAYELHPFLFNADSVAKFIAAHKEGKPDAPPEILIELYFVNNADFADLKGINNSEGLDLPGISLNICLDPEFHEEYRDYVADPTQLNSIPVEYYHIVWQSFAGHPMNARALPIRSAMIDPSAISNTYAANKYVLEIVRDYLTKKQQVDLALSYRKMHDIFLSDGSVTEINKELADKSEVVSDKTLSVAMDTTTRASWETGVLPHLDDIPLTLVGKGEQNSVKIKLAMVAADACTIPKIISRNFQVMTRFA